MKSPVGFKGLEEINNPVQYSPSEKIKHTINNNSQQFYPLRYGVGPDSIPLIAEPRTDILMIAGVTSVAIGLFSSPFTGPVSGLILLTGIILIIISLTRIKHYPEKYKGKWLGIATLILLGALLLAAMVAVALLITGGIAFL